MIYLEGNNLNCKWIWGTAIFLQSFSTSIDSEWEMVVSFIPNNSARKTKMTERTATGKINGMSAIILAGGKSSRMKMDKALLPVSGTRLIEKVAENIGDYFDEIIISAQSTELYDFLPYRVVADKEPGHGPLMGILSGLEASSNDINFIIATDIPDIDTNFLAHLKTFAQDYEIVVPVTKDDLYEPLFAFYNKSLIPRIETLLANHIRQVFQLYPMATMKKVTMSENGWYFNLNTNEDYQTYREKIEGESGETG
jgi:molybdopterin-guanine dinucleotide biosynthesis protein A